MELLNCETVKVQWDSLDWEGEVTSLLIFFPTYLKISFISLNFFLFFFFFHFYFFASAYSPYSKFLRNPTKHLKTIITCLCAFNQKSLAAIISNIKNKKFHSKHRINFHFFISDVTFIYFLKTTLNFNDETIKYHKNIA